MAASIRSIRQSGEGTVPTAFADATAARVTHLNSGWEFAEIPAGGDLFAADAAALTWRPAIVPGTVAATLRATGDLDEDRGNDLDGREFVFRKRFRHDGATSEGALIFEGLATRADAWLNGTLVLSARNMFRCHSVEVGSLLRADNEVILHFRALVSELERKRPRARWTTRLVNHRNLRYVRTSLLGRMPGWAPPHPPVGPWRGIRLVESRRVELARLSISSTLDGSEGVVCITMRGRVVAGDAPEALEIRVADSRVSRRVIKPSGDGFEVVAELRVPNAIPWWSHDLGTPFRYRLGLALRFGGESLDIGSVQIGFRRIRRRDNDPEGFALRINDRDVFCRGACWTPVDAVGFSDDPAEIRRIVGLVRHAGFNMLRLSGATVYESEAFYDACDELGVMVWQDFMFASMDYPEDDGEYAEEVRIESEQVLARVHRHPCLAVLCGNSEVEQQAAMNGLAPYSGLTPLFRHTLKEAGQRWCPGIPYVSSSPTGGTLPFHPEAGVSHYFGVGAYLRPLGDARASRVRFASECLAFSNVPEDVALDELFGNDVLSVHSPRYKQGVPRDAGAGWDFADVTDHYLEQLFGCNVPELRYTDTGRYLALARVTPGEMMARTIGLWRAGDSVCHGALVWFLRDLRPGAGWGVLDSAGRPKAPYWFLKRACAPQAIWFTDEGLNGLRVQVRNDRQEPLTARLRIRLIRSNGVEVGSAETDLRLEECSAQMVGVDDMMGRFADSTYAYRFGPCQYAIAEAELVHTDGTVIATSHHLPMGLAHAMQDDIALSAKALPQADGSHELHIETRELALYVRVSVGGYLPADNYFHIPPGRSRTVVLRPVGTERQLRARISALNARSQVSVELRGLARCRRRFRERCISVRPALRYSAGCTGRLVTARRTWDW